jgi:hypothetical protein
MLVPHVRVVRCAPKSHPCPHCGKPAARKRPLHRRIRSLAYRQVAYLDVHYAEYQARCGCCKFFRSWPVEVPPKADYDDKVRQAVLDRILEDGLNVQRTLAAMKRDFLLPLSCASTNFTWAASLCCWPPTPSVTYRWVSPWSDAMTRTTCGGSS